MTAQPTLTLTGTGNLRIHIPMHIRRMRGRKMIFAPQALDGSVPDSPSEVQGAVVQALGRAFSWSEAIESGKLGSAAELARHLDMDNSYVVRILKLTTLAPDIIEAILNGEEPSGLSLARLVRTFPMDWEKPESPLSGSPRAEPLPRLQKGMCRNFQKVPRPGKSVPTEVRENLMEEGGSDANAEVQAGTDRNGVETDQGGDGEWELDAAGLQGGWNSYSDV